MLIYDAKNKYSRLLQAYTNYKKNHEKIKNNTCLFAPKAIKYKVSIYA